MQSQTMSLTVVAVPTNDDEQNRAASTTTNQRPSRSLGKEHAPEPFDSENLPVNLVPGVQRFLRVANQIEIHEPRVAYVCRFRAFEEAHKLDPSSSGRGVRQFKNCLLQRLDQDQNITSGKTKGNDLHEVRRVYWEYKDIAAVLYEICCNNGMPAEED